MTRTEILRELIQLRNRMDLFKTNETKPVVFDQDTAVATCQFLVGNLITDICTSIEIELKAKGKIK